MPLDAIFLTALTAELNETLPGSRIDKIQQPDRETVLLSLRTQGAGNRRLLLSASPNHPRIHYTAEKFEQPAQPPMFCMLLRKHLSGGRILSLTQLPMERAVDLCIESADELGELSRKHIWLELMGRNSNLILTGPDGRILDCLRRVDFEMSEKRQVLPGLFYREPPTQGKLDLRAETPEALQAELERLRTQTAFDGWLMDRYAGISPLIARELVFRLTGSVEADLSALEPADLAPRLCEALHGLLTQCHYATVSGTAVARDFVELPSQINENWAFQKEVLAGYAKHYETGEVIPDELVDKIIAAGNFNQGFMTTELCAASILDMKWHELSSVEGIDVEEFEKKACEEMGLIGEIIPRYRTTYFNHIFNSGYSAGY